MGISFLHKVSLATIEVRVYVRRLRSAHFFIREIYTGYQEKLYKGEIVMENYKLGAEEVVLYKSDVWLTGEKGVTEMILTNINLIFINKKEKEVKVFTYPVTDIKMYEGVPQIRTKGNSAEIYLTDTEVKIEFLAYFEIHKFVGAVKKLLTGETGMQRGAKKVKETIELIDDTFGIDTVETTSNMITNGVSGGLANTLGKFGKALLNKKKK